MTTKHTPGPWTLAEASNTIPIKGANGRTVASVRFNADFDLPDARLIAAAPDLLAALHNAHSLIALAIQNCAWGDESTDERDSIDDAKSVLEQARAAIAKART